MYTCIYVCVCGVYACKSVRVRVCVCAPLGWECLAAVHSGPLLKGVDGKVEERGPERGRHLKIMTIHTVVSILAMAYCQQILSFP